MVPSAGSAVSSVPTGLSLAPYLATRLLLPWVVQINTGHPGSHLLRKGVGHSSVSFFDPVKVLMLVGMLNAWRPMVLFTQAYISWVARRGWPLESKACQLQTKEKIEESRCVKLLGQM